MTDPSVFATGMFSRGQLAALALLMEITAPKPGNVHRGADFEDVTFFDFAASAVALTPVFDAATGGARLGRIVYDAVAAMRAAVATNTHLGTVLLLAPLALVDDAEPFASGISRVLRNLDAEDARLVYAAIRLAQPGGMGHVAENDIAGAAPGDLLTAMCAAAGRDLVARQYANDFQQVLNRVVPLLREGIERGWGLSDVIIRTHLAMMAEFPDSLIARKCGPRVAEESADRAGYVLDRGAPGNDDYLAALADFDFWLRSDHHRRNPGTTADLITAGLFVALREGIIRLPYRW